MNCPICNQELIKQSDDKAFRKSWGAYYVCHVNGHLFDKLLKYQIINKNVKVLIK